MRTKSLLIFGCLLAVILSLSFNGCKKNDKNSYPYTLSFLSEEYEPFNYSVDGKLTGLAPEILGSICNKLDIPPEVSVMNWDEAYSKALETDNAVLFSTVLNSTRRDLFKWAGPIASVDWIFYSSATNQLSLSSVDDARTVGKIGVLKDYAITQYLIDQGFTNLVYCNDNADAFNRLLKGEIDIFPSNKIATSASLSALGKLYYSVDEKLVIKTDLVYFAFNKQVPDEVVSDFQSAIDEMKENGSMLSLYRKYMNSSDFPESFQVYTENYPPLTFRDQFGNINGFGSDIAKEIMKRNQVYAGIKLSLWSVGYDLALNNPNFCLFTMDKTAARENLFQWVGPLGTNTTYFYVKAGSGITIASVDQARNLGKVGVVSSWFSAQSLISQGFTNLVSDSDPETMTKMLMNGEVDAFVCSSVTFPDILKNAGYQYNQVTAALALMSSDYYIAFSKNTDPAIPQKWQAALTSMKSDGTYEAIRAKWLP